MEKKLPLTSYSSEGKRHFEKLFRSRKDKNEVNNNASTTLNSQPSLTLAPSTPLNITPN